MPLKWSLGLSGPGRLHFSDAFVTSSHRLHDPCEVMEPFHIVQEQFSGDSITSTV